MTMCVICCLQPEEKQRASQQFTKLQAAMKVLGVSGEEQKVLWFVLGGIYHLGAARATKGALTLMSLCPSCPCVLHVLDVLCPSRLSAGRRQFEEHEWAQKASYLLGCSLDDLSSCVFKHQGKGLKHSTSFRGGLEEGLQGDGSGTNSYIHHGRSNCLVVP